MIHISGVYYILHCGKKKWIKPVNSSMYHVYAGMFLSLSQLGNILVLFHWIYLNVHFLFLFFQQVLEHVCLAA